MPAKPRSSIAHVEGSGTVETAPAAALPPLTEVDGPPLPPVELDVTEASGTLITIAFDVALPLGERG
jgi:hypothetical protein